MFPVGLGLKMLVISAVFTVFLFGFLVPVFQQYKFKKKMIYVFIFIGGMCFISATTQASYSSERKQPNSIIYVLDANKNEAYWASYNTKVDEFTQQFLGENPNQGSYDNNITASKYRTGIKLHSKAPMKTLEKPIIQLVSDTIVGNDRIVDLQIISLRNANKIELLTKIPIQFKSLKVNGELLKSSNNTTFVLSVNNGTLLSYFRTAINDVLALEFMVDKNQKFDLEVFEVKFDLLTNPSFIVQKRADDMMPMPFVTNDATIVKTNIKF